MKTIPALPADLLWYRAVLQLRCTASFGQVAHPLSVLEAIVKGISEQSGLGKSVTAVFYWQNKRAATMRIRKGQVIVLQVDLFTDDASKAQQWLAFAAQYFQPPNAGRNFMVQSVSALQTLCSADFVETLHCNVSTEYCLDFHTPLPFAFQRGQCRCYLTAAALLSLLVARLHKLFGRTMALPTTMQALPYYWDYLEITHRSASQSGHDKLLNGCVGKLYLKGEAATLAAWLPWLRFAEAVGVSKHLSFGLGRFQLLVDSPAFFAGDLTNPTRLARVIDETLERYDDALPALAEPSGLNVATFATQLAQTLKHHYAPDAYQAFVMKKHHGKGRLLEKASFTDLIVQRHLLRLLHEVFDKVFADESIGFRKGLSRKTAIERVQAAMAEGFDTVLQADIADFFASVQLEILQAQLDKLLPERDTLLRTLLAAVLHAPRQRAGQIETRHCGLAMGSPLSPLLANVYLSQFDEKIKTSAVRLIRYADDFLILTKGKAAAEALLINTEQVLHGLGLHLQQEKTAIHAIQDGFEFLGLHFSPTATQDKQTPDTLRKPLYVTEPYAFLGINGDSLELRHGSSVHASVPLRRISELLLLAPCSYSSTLIEQCLHHDIAIVLTAGNGRHVATLNRPTAQHYRVAQQQMNRFAQLSDGEKLAVAQALVRGKIANYLAFLQQHYQASDKNSLEQLSQWCDAVSTANDVAAVRGFEGVAAAACFQLWTQHIENPDFVWQGRHRRPADKLNSLLNFGYHLLFCRLNVLVRGLGLNPFIGFLHSPTDRFEVLVCDIEELFRPHIDRLVLRVLNLNIITAADFSENEHGFWLSREAKQRFLSEFARELERQPNAKHLPTLSQALYLQAQALRDFFLLSQTDLPLFAWQV